MNKKWYENSYRRNLIDMHIESWDKTFLSQLDTEKYIKLLKKANVQTAMIYANSHVGLCNWHIKHGEMHKGLKGTDFLGDMLKKCKQANISTVVYFTVVFDNWAYDNIKEARTINEFGHVSRDHSEERLFLGKRYGTCCPNNQKYRSYILAQLSHLCTSYEFDGTFIDMTFWPVVCYCPSCIKRYKEETGEEIPRIINWDDPIWVGFQRKREEWLGEFTNVITNHIKGINPQITVEHQFSPVLYNWKWGSTIAVSQAGDYAGGDFYGGISQQPFVCKIYRNLSKNLPFEYMTSRCDPSLRYHTCTKSKQNLALHAYIALAHEGAFLFIDAIDPIGTLYEGLYDVMGEIFRETEKYEKYVGGRLIRDAAIYYPLTSKVDPSYNGMEVTAQTAGDMYPQFEAAMAAAATLRAENLLYDVISVNNLDSIDDVKVVLLTDVYLLDQKESEMIEQYVKNGGALYISGCPRSSIIMNMLGIEYIGKTSEKITYITPKKDGDEAFGGMICPLTVDDCQCIVRLKEEASLLGTITLPYTDPNDSSIFASIHSNPPGRATSHPAIIMKEYGKGRIIWVSAAIEKSKSMDSRIVFRSLISLLVPSFTLKSNSPAPCEILAFYKDDNIVVHICNQQEWEPIVAAHNIEIQLSLDLIHKKVEKVLKVPENRQIHFEIKEGRISFLVDKVELYSMYIICTK